MFGLRDAVKLSTMDSSFLVLSTQQQQILTSKKKVLVTKKKVLVTKKKVLKTKLQPPVQLKVFLMFNANTIIVYKMVFAAAKKKILG